MSTTPQFQRHALGLPAGSIRALLAIGVLAYLWVLVLIPGKEGKGLLVEKEASQAFIYLQFLMVLILAHFFTAHGKTIGSQVSRGSPLGLPSGSVRLLLLAGYLGLSYYLYTTKPTFAMPESGPVLLLLAILLSAFFVGYWVTAIVRGLFGGWLPAWFQDIQAWFALMGLLLLGIIVMVRLVINPGLQQQTQIDLGTMEAILAGVVGFYFGARS